MISHSLRFAIFKKKSLSLRFRRENLNRRAKSSTRLPCVLHAKSSTQSPPCTSLPHHTPTPITTLKPDANSHEFFRFSSRALIGQSRKHAPSDREIFVYLACLFNKIFSVYLNYETIKEKLFRMSEKLKKVAVKKPRERIAPR